MVKITLYHQNTPVTCHAVEGNSFSVGSHPQNDLVLAGSSVKERHLTIFRDKSGRWQARRDDLPNGPITALEKTAKIALGPFALQLDPTPESLRGTEAPGPTDRDRALHPEGLEWAGTSMAIQLLKSDTEAVAPLRAPVLVTGESGTGKELVARGLHFMSGRTGRFVSVNCGALTDSLLEDTLFGHEKGSFTDARTIREGVFEQAQGGTLFLDEIGEMPLCHQAALLRVLEEKFVRRIGASTELRVDFRLVTATNRRLEDLVAQKRFRADLYHRIATLPLETTPLRERIEDVPPIARYLLEALQDELGRRILNATALSRLMRYSWPGNVRELKNVLYRAAALAPRTALFGADFDLPDEQIRTKGVRLSTVPLNQLERFVERYSGNISKAAKALGVARTTLRDRLTRLGDGDDAAFDALEVGLTG